MSNKEKKIDKYYGMFRSLSIKQQIFYFFLFLLAIYTSLLVFLKLDQLNVLLTIHLNKNYYSSVVIAKLNKQREIKTAIDNINILNENNIYDREIMLMNIYTKEMKKISENKEEHKCYYEASLDLITGGNFGYTFMFSIIFNIYV